MAGVNERPVDARVPERGLVGAPEGPRRAIVIPGARKAGTSSLYAALASHPGVRSGRFKEPQFFALDPDTVASHMDWYVSLFSPAAELDSAPVLDASTFYLMSERAPALIARHVDEPRIVIVLRDPVERAFAGYEYIRHRVPSPEGRDFEDIVTALERAGGGVAGAEGDILAEAVRDERVPARYYTGSFHGDHFGAPFETRLEDPLNILRYFAESSYSRHVPRWQRQFPGLVRLIAFERLIAETPVVLEEIRSFCGLEPWSGLRELPRENPTRVPRGRLARRILRRAARRPPGTLVDAALRLGRTTWIGRMVRERLLETRRPRLDPRLRNRCRSLLDAEYAWWSERYPSIAEWWS